MSLLSIIPEDVLASAVCPFLDAGELCAFGALSRRSKQLLSPRYLGILHRELLASARYKVDLDRAAATAWFLRRDSSSSSFTDGDAAHLLKLSWALRRSDVGGRFQHTDVAMRHQDKIVGLHLLSDTALIAACSFDSSVSVFHVAGRARGSRQPTITNPQLHLHHTSRRALTCLTSFEIPDHVQVIAAGDKSGNLVVWSSTLFGAEGAAGHRFCRTSVLDEIKTVVNLSADHIRSMIHLRRASRQKLRGMDLLLVGDGDGRIFVVCVKFHPSNDGGDTEEEARFDMSVLQTSWCHESAIVGLQETSDGFLSICKSGECGVWSLDSSSTLSSKAGSTSSSEHVVHFSLDSLSKIVPAGGRAVTCLVLVGEKNQRQRQSRPQAECKEAVVRGRRSIVVGTRGCYGTKSKSIRALLKDHCVLGISIEIDGSHDIQWQLPIATTVTSIFPLGRLLVVVAERASRDEGTAVSVWDVHSCQELSRFGLLECGGKSAGERVTRLLPSFDRHGRLVAWFAGCDSGAILRFHDGDRAEERSCGGPKRK